MTTSKEAAEVINFVLDGLENKTLTKNTAKQILLSLAEENKPQDKTEETISFVKLSALENGVLNFIKSHNPRVYLNNFEQQLFVCEDVIKSFPNVTEADIKQAIKKLFSIGALIVDKDLKLNIETRIAKFFGNNK